MEEYVLETPEQRLTLLLCRLTFSGNDKQEITELVKRPINWMKVFEYTVSNKITTLVWHNLKQLKIQYTIPKYLKSILKFTEIGIQKQNEIYLQFVKEILEEFKRRESTCIPVKGSYFIPYMYENYQIRYMGDLDILVKKSDITVVHEIMKKKGFVQGQYITSQNLIIPLGRKDDITWKLKMSHLYPFVKAIDSEYLGAIKCDFRFALDDSLNLEPINEMIDSGKNMDILPAHRFIYLCTHLYEEAKKEIYVTLGKDINLIKFCDIREYVLHYMKQNDFEQAIVFAKKHSLGKAVYYTLWYLNQIYHDGYEKELLEQIHIDDFEFLVSFEKTGDGGTKVWMKSFWERMFSGYNLDEIVKK